MSLSRICRELVERSGSQTVARADADGYTLLLGGTNTNAVTPAFYKNLSYDPIKTSRPLPRSRSDFQR